MALPNAPTPTNFQHEKESLENDAPIEGNACEHMIEEEASNLPPVSPFSFGEGLPYAPEGWPNPGDVWSWRVGSKTNSSGYFRNRYLYPPISLQISPRNARLASKPDVVGYLQSKFPNMEIKAFFGLFSWKVPSTHLSPHKEDLDFEQAQWHCAIHVTDFTQWDKAYVVFAVAAFWYCLGEDATKEIGTQRKLKRKAHLCSQPTRKSFRVHRRLSPVVQDANDIIDLCNSAEDLKETSDSELDQSSCNSTMPGKKIVGNLVDLKGSGMQRTGEKLPNITILENFDDFLNTLEDLLVVPHTNPVAPATTTLEDEMESWKKKLSSLLAMDFPLLFCGTNVVEIVKLASQIRRDPNLSVDQLIKLKLVEQIPLVSEAFLEAQGNIEKAEKFFADLEAKRLQAPRLKNEYIELKDEVTDIEADIDKSSLAIQEIKDQILQLQSKCKEMYSDIETMQKRKVELTSKQAMVANSISTIVQDVQLGLSEKSKWELKKACSARRVAEIHKKFITLKGLTF